MNESRPLTEERLKLSPFTLEPVNRLQLIKYAGASCDFNPIHTIDQGAVDAGLPGIIAHGMLTMATIGRLFSPYAGEGFLQEFAVRFNGMVFLGDVITVAGIVEEEQSTADGAVFVCSVTASNQDDRVVAGGTARFLLFA